MALDTFSIRRTPQEAERFDQPAKLARLAAIEERSPGG